MKLPLSCIDCAFHRVAPDPDPLDWFCDDDVAVLCASTNNKPATVACRPYNARKETAPPPRWCPLRKET
jgi:hypothetical protein